MQWLITLAANGAKEFTRRNISMLPQRLHENNIKMASFSGLILTMGISNIKSANYSTFTDNRQTLSTDLGGEGSTS